ncbi:MAG: ADP-ribosylglycohydrolase family protein [Methanoculleaceae archaeon]
MPVITGIARPLGALVGLAVGDAMGAPLEGMPPPSIRVRRMAGGGIHGTRPGHYTDDTIQACAVAESLVHCHGFNAADIVRRLLRGYMRHPWFFGPTSSAVLRRVAAGRDPVEAAAAAHRERGWSRSNGSVMRGIPLGIYYPPHRVWPVSLACSALTHYDTVAGECSACINRIISGLCRSEETYTAFRRACSSIRNPELASIISSSTRLPVEPSLDAVDITHSAIRILLTTRSFYDAVITAVNLGGDADTLGSVVGAAAGARYGIDQIPSEWLYGLHHWQKIVGTAVRLWQAAE